MEKNNWFNKKVDEVKNELNTDLNQGLTDKQVIDIRIEKKAIMNCKRLKRKIYFKDF